MASYAAPWEPALHGTTRAAIILLAGGSVVLVPLAALRSGPGLTLWVLAIAVPALAGSFWLARARAPLGFTVDHFAVRVERPLGPVVIPLSTVRAVSLLPGPFPQPHAWRGTLGVYGYTGACRTPALGAFRLYATRREGLVLVDTTTGRFVLSPEPPEDFVDEVQSRLAGAQREEAPSPAARPT
jgi:hypothetical protein